MYACNTPTHTHTYSYIYTHTSPGARRLNNNRRNRCGFCNFIVIHGYEVKIQTITLIKREKKRNIFLLVQDSLM